MFDYVHTERGKLDDGILREAALADLRLREREILPLLWADHCLECSPPECYTSCLLFESNRYGRCMRLDYTPVEYELEALPFPATRLRFRKWSKLLCAFNSDYLVSPGSTAYQSYRRGRDALKTLGAPLALLGKKYTDALARALHHRFALRFQNGMACDPAGFELLFVLYNMESRPVEMVLDVQDRDFYSLNRIRVSLRPGYNECSVPVRKLAADLSKIYALEFHPADDSTPELIVFFSDLVKARADAAPEKKVKCVVWDLDNTLWDGILGEDGADGVQLREDMLTVIRELDAKGILNSIASKNDEAPALAALRRFGIDELFVSPMISWGAKSESIRAIARTLDIGLDTFVFVDDSFFELHEVSENCPAVRTCDVKDIREYVKSSAFDVPVTEESRRRRLSYREIAVRNKAASEHADDLTAFLVSCHMKVHIAVPDEHELPRCYELVQRTNQLNLSAERLSLGEIEALVRSDAYDCLRIRVDDDYGDYGLVGFAVFDVSDSETVVLRHFVFSCRAARKKIEQSFFEAMIARYADRGFKTLALECRVTEKNRLMREVLEESRLFTRVSEGEGSYRLVHEMAASFEPLQIVQILED